ncbi:MAG: indolepyruvate oxidoreductase subunit beta family protein [Rhodospirillales bacterium]|nr:indolepyruvate oxidoreductase subunit beta family protein [Rhodospirillales bacterium]
MTGDRPIGVLIAALGGEGGGVLTDWIVRAAMRSDLPVQSSSLPGVAQRTGATTYYVEIFPRTHRALEGRRPVLGLYPVAGAIDLMIATELLEAGRAMREGFVSPERTTLVAATHRVYATVEKMAMGDGRAAAEPILDAARRMPATAILFDPGADDRARSLPLNAIMLGAAAGSGTLPIPEDAFAQSIRDSGIAVEANLAGFDLGLRLARGEVVLAAPKSPAPTEAVAEGWPADLAAALDGLPGFMSDLAAAGVRRLVNYQDADYARLYLARLSRLAAEVRDQAALREAARHLALWMAYDDIVRVADLKSRPDRYRRVRDEVGAKAGEPVRVVEHFSPGVEEVSALLTPALGKRLFAWAERRNLLDRLSISLHVESTSLSGYWRLRLLAGLRRWRRRTWRFAEEQALIERWLGAIGAAAEKHPRLAREVAECARLVKGYGDTHRRGHGNLLRILDAVAAGRLDADGVARAREAALADPDGKAIGRVLDQRANSVTFSTNPAARREPQGG